MNGNSYYYFIIFLVIFSISCSYVTRLLVHFLFPILVFHDKIILSLMSQQVLYQFTYLIGDSYYVVLKLYPFFYSYYFISFEIIMRF